MLDRWRNVNMMMHLVHIPNNMHELCEGVETMCVAVSLEHVFCQPVM